MRKVRIARALLKPLIGLVNTALGWSDRVHEALLGIRYRLIRADMGLAAKVTIKELNDLMKRLSEGKVCGYAEELGIGSDEIIEILEAAGCVVMRIIDYGDMINSDVVLGCPKLRREVSVFSNFKIREWVCVSWMEESEEKLTYAGEPKVIYVDDLESLGRGE